MKPSRPNKTPKKTALKTKSSVKDPVEVYCRIRPLEDETDTVCLKAIDDRNIVLFSPDTSQNIKQKEVFFKFKHVFDESTSQKQLFDNVCLPLVQDLLQGKNGLLFTYGVTSSGKTYTMTGKPQDGGLLPRSLDVIFNSIKDVQAKKFLFKPDNLNGFDVQSTAEAMFDQQKELSVFNKNKNRMNERGDWRSRIPDTTIIEDIIPDMNIAVFISYVEIYNNFVYDLLDDIVSDLIKKTPNSKMIREDAAKNMYVFGVKEVEVKTVDEALELFYKGQARRKVSQTALNFESSRSHSTFTIRVVQAPLDPIGAEVLQDRTKLVISQLSLVDLAGSERHVRTKNTGHKLREAGNINNSLMALRMCIEILRDNQNQGICKMVPYRESKLTHLFKTFFEGEGKIRMVVCVNPHADCYEELSHVLKFAEMTQDVMVTRSTPVLTPSIPGLRPGRGKLYGAAVKKAREEGIPISDINIILPTLYNLGPDFPPLIIETYDESMYMNLIEFLNARIARRNTFVQDLSRRQEDFRKCLIAVEKESGQLKQENSALKMDLDHREQQIRSLEQKLSSSEENIDMLSRHVDELKRKADVATSEASERERMLNEQAREVERMKTKMQEKLASEKDRYKRIMERRLAEKQAEVERKMCITGEKFRQLREILYDDGEWVYAGDINIPGPSIPSTATSEASVPVTRSKKRSSAEIGEPSVENRIPKARSATDVHGNNGAHVQFSGQSSRNDFESVFYKENRPPISSQGTRGVAVANPRHRRSTSTGDAWIEHKPVGNLELNTVLQPAIKKKKSVSKLEVKDVTNSEKYVLQHQEQDSQGEVETQLFKADIIPSAGGGAQVIFNDVEKLRQVSPPPVYNLRKRSGDNLPLREVEERCTVSVECHGLPSKITKRK